MHLSRLVKRIGTLQKDQNVLSISNVYLNIYIYTYIYTHILGIYYLANIYLVASMEENICVSAFHALRDKKKTPPLSCQSLSASRRHTGIQIDQRSE